MSISIPDTPAAAEATKKLAELAKDENQGMRMSKQFLLENPEMFGPRGLGLKASLFDGDPRNMEIADRGVNLLSDNEILVYYQTPWGVRSQSYSLTKPVADRFFVTLREKNLQVATVRRQPARQRQRRRHQESARRPSSRPNGNGAPAIVEEREDTTFTLIREAGGPAAIIAECWTSNCSPKTSATRQQI